MKLTEEQKNNIKQEYTQWKDKMYANNSLQERKAFGQFFTPPELSIKMIEMFNDLEGTILDPTVGAGNLIAAIICAGADPKKCYGIELDLEVLDICKERLCALGVPEVNLHQGNALYSECYEDFSESYDYKKACEAAEKRIKEERKNRKK